MSRWCAREASSGLGGQKELPSTGRHLDQARRRHGKMKYDMAGGATMIGAMRAIALLKPKVKVIGIVCATEICRPGRRKSGDVQIAMSGKSIEIINTDAEGRLVPGRRSFLCAAVGLYGTCRRATLTGAVVVALGYTNAGSR